MYTVNTNNRGFSLVEVLVSIGILSIVATGMSGAFSSWMKSNQVVDSRREANGLVSQLRNALGNHASCTANFKGTVVPVAVNQPVNVNKGIAVYDQSGNAAVDASNKKIYVVNVASKTSSDTYSFQAGSVTLSFGADLQSANGGTNSVATLSVTDVRSNGLWQTRSIPLYVTYNTASRQITDCVSGIDTETSAAQSGCAIATNNQSYYNTTSGSCVSKVPPPQKKWAQSTNPYSGTCPTGWQTIGCLSQPPSNWVNPLVESCQNDTTGKPLCSQALPAVCDYTFTRPGDRSSTITGCSCLYASGIDPTNGGKYPGTDLSQFFTIDVLCSAN